MVKGRKGKLHIAPGFHKLLLLEETPLQHCTKIRRPVPSLEIRSYDDDVVVVL
jgi:hypothetical protein